MATTGAQGRLNFAPASDQSGHRLDGRAPGGASSSAVRGIQRKQPRKSLLPAKSNSTTFSDRTTSKSLSTTRPRREPPAHPSPLETTSPATQTRQCQPRSPALSISSDTGGPTLSPPRSSLRSRTPHDAHPGRLPCPPPGARPIALLSDSDPEVIASGTASSDVELDLDVDTHLDNASRLPSAYNCPSSPSRAPQSRSEARRELFASSWATAFPPHSLSDLAVHPAKVAAVHGWLRDAFLGPPGICRMRRILCIRGPTGSGKSALLQALQQGGDFRTTSSNTTSAARDVSSSRLSSRSQTSPDVNISSSTSDRANWGFETVPFDAHSLPSFPHGSATWDRENHAPLTTAFGAFLHEAVSGRTLALAQPPTEVAYGKDESSSSHSDTAFPLPRSPPASAPSRAMSLSPSTSRFPLSQLSALLERDPDPPPSSRPSALVSRSPWRRTQSTPYGSSSTVGPSPTKPLLSKQPVNSSSQRHRLILVEDLPNLYHKSTRDAFQAALLAFLNQPFQPSRTTLPLVVVLSESAPQLGSAPEEGVGEASAATHAGAGQSWSDRLANVWDSRTLLGDVRNHPAYADVELNPASKTLLKQALRRLVDCALQFCAQSITEPSLPSDTSLTGDALAHAESSAGFTRIVGYTVADALARSSLTGDLRGASITLQETLRSMVQAGTASLQPPVPSTAPAASGKRRPRAGTKAAARLAEVEAKAQAEAEVAPAIEQMATRVPGFDLWHLVGKILYNKQQPLPSSGSTLSSSQAFPHSIPTSRRNKHDTRLFERILRAKASLSQPPASVPRTSQKCTRGTRPHPPCWPKEETVPASDPITLWASLTVSPADLSLFLSENTPRFTSTHEQTLEYGRRMGLSLPPESTRITYREDPVRTQPESHVDPDDSDATQPDTLPPPTSGPDARHVPAQQEVQRDTGVIAAARVADALSQADAYFGSPAGGGGPGDAILIGGGKSLNTSSFTYAPGAAGAAEEYEFHTVVRGVTRHLPPYLQIGSDGRISSLNTEAALPTRWSKRPPDAPPPPKVRKPAWYATRRAAQSAHTELREALQPVPSAPAVQALVTDPFTWPVIGSLGRLPCALPLPAERIIAIVRFILTFCGLYDGWRGGQWPPNAVQTCALWPPFDSTGRPILTTTKNWPWTMNLGKVSPRRRLPLLRTPPVHGTVKAAKTMCCSWTKAQSRPVSCRMMRSSRWTRSWCPLFRKRMRTSSMMLSGRLSH